MTTMSAARQAILSRFITNFVDVVFSDVPVGDQRNKRFRFDNEAGEALDGATPEGESWCRFSVQETDSRQETLGAIGARKYRRQGAARLEIYCLSDKGMLKRDALVASFRSAFEGVSFSGVYFTDCQVQDIGIEGAWWRASALGAFWFEEIK